MSIIEKYGINSAQLDQCPICNHIMNKINLSKCKICGQKMCAHHIIKGVCEDCNSEQEFEDDLYFSECEEEDE